MILVTNNELASPNYRIVDVRKLVDDLTSTLSALADVASHLDSEDAGIDVERLIMHEVRAAFDPIGLNEPIYLLDYFGLREGEAANPAEAVRLHAEICSSGCQS